MTHSASASRFLDLRALAALEHMRFTTRQRIEGAYTGRHPSRQRGGSGEFVDYREHSNGEDLRRIDWKVLSRTGRAYVRLYQEEANLVCTLVVDASGSMDFGGDDRRGARSAHAGETGSKLAYVQFLATALSHVINRQQDQVGLALISDGLAEFLPPAGTASHVARLQQALEKATTRPTTDLAGGLDALFERLPRRGVLLVMSDFLVPELEPVFAAIRRFRHRHFDVVVLHVVHPHEERLPEGLAYRFVGLEDDGQVDCSPAEIRRLYEERFEAHAATVRSISLAAGCDYRRVSTGVPYLQTLGGFLVERTG